MKVLIIFLSLSFTVGAFSQSAYKIEKNPWGDDIVRFPGVTGDLFATHEFQTSRGPGWKAKAIEYIENETDAIEISGKIEGGDISSNCNLDWDEIDDFLELDELSYKWKALKPIRSPQSKTILYVVETYADYVVKMNSGKKITCPYLINEYVFLNRTPVKFLGITDN